MQKQKYHFPGTSSMRYPEYLAKRFRCFIISRKTCRILGKAELLWPYTWIHFYGQWLPGEPKQNLLSILRIALSMIQTACSSLFGSDLMLCPLSWAWVFEIEDGGQQGGGGTCIIFCRGWGCSSSNKVFQDRMLTRESLLPTFKWYMWIHYGRRLELRVSLGCWLLSAR